MADAMYSLPTLLCSRAKIVASVPRKSRRPAALEIPEDHSEAAFRVKNTFIDSGVALLSPSLGDFYRERVVMTCPSKRVGCLSGRLQEALEGGDELEAPSPFGIQSPCEIQTPCGLQNPYLIQTPVAERCQQFPWQSVEAMQHTRILCQELESQHFLPHGVPCFEFVAHAQQPCAMIEGTLSSVTDLRLADLLDVDGATMSSMATDAVVSAQQVGQCEYVPNRSVLGLSTAPGMPPSPERAPWYSASQPSWSSAPLVPPAPVVPPPPPGPALGSPELPSIGSAAHGKGSCRPCAFLHTKGCENGLACTFCHLCEPGERKRRQKEKLQQRRAAQQARLTSKAERAA